MTLTIVWPKDFARCQILAVLQEEQILQPVLQVRGGIQNQTEYIPFGVQSDGVLVFAIRATVYVETSAEDDTPANRQANQ